MSFISYMKIKSNKIPISSSNKFSMYALKQLKKNREEDVAYSAVNMNKFHWKSFRGKSAFTTSVKWRRKIE